MLMLFWAGAGVCAYLGFKLYDWWAPTAVAVAVAVGQFVVFETIGASRGPTAQLIAFAAMDLVMFHATFGIGRGLGQRRLKRRKGSR
jgi:hypothetical protein